jgi:hypothetical protein
MAALYHIPWVGTIGGWASGVDEEGLKPPAGGSRAARWMRGIPGDRLKTDRYIAAAQLCPDRARSGLCATL